MVNGKFVNNCNKELVEKEFWVEFNVIFRFYYCNFVVFLGYCVEEDDLFFVYEFMVNGFFR